MEEEKGGISKEKLVSRLNQCLSSKILLEDTLGMVFENLGGADINCKLSALKTLEIVLNVNYSIPLF